MSFTKESAVDSAITDLARRLSVSETVVHLEDVIERVAKSPLRQQLRVVEADFREVVGQFDKVVSIGVLEHAGRDQIDAVVKAHAESLKMGGLGMLLHQAVRGFELWFGVKPEVTSELYALIAADVQKAPKQ